jgi:NitT/TauT family transport system substrate-binding protein
MLALFLSRSAGVLLAGLLVAGFSRPIGGPTPAAEAAQDPTRLQVGLLGGASDAAIFIAMDQGYLREVGLDLDLTTFDSGARMVVPLGAGQLDIGGGAHSAGLFNAVARGVPIKLVADKGSTPPGFGYEALLIRRDLAQSAQIRGPGDLRGMRVAVAARGTSGEVSIARWLATAGLDLDAVELVELGMPEHPAALGGGAVAASVSSEPFVTRIVDEGLGTLYQRTDELTPNRQIGEVMYGDQFIQGRPDAARQFMIAYVRAVRFYNDAFAYGDAAKRQTAVQILTRHTTLKDPALYDRMAMPGIDPDGRMNVATINQDQDFWLSQGTQQSRVDLNGVVDLRFADAALQALGPYQAARP